MPITRVENFRNVAKLWNKNTGRWSSADYVYIGRRNLHYNLPQSVWANPYRLSSDEQPGATIERYQEYILKEIEKKSVNIAELRGKILVCWCHPEPCHGDVLLKLIHELTPEAFRCPHCSGLGFTRNLKSNLYELCEMCGGNGIITT